MKKDEIVTSKMKLGLGVEDFKEAITLNHYIDKTKFIRKRI